MSCPRRRNRRDHPPEVIVVVNGQDAEAVLICHGMGLDWLLTVPDLGYAFGPARMGMRLVIGGVNEDRSPILLTFKIFEACAADFLTPDGLGS